MPGLQNRHPLPAARPCGRLPTELRKLWRQFPDECILDVMLPNRRQF